MSRLTVKDLHTGRTVEVSERSWTISLKKSKMPDGSGKQRYILQKTEPRLKTDNKKPKIDLSETDSNGGGEGGEN